ncbi:uncharacterized protein LOC120327160 [Styela clava]
MNGPESESVVKYNEENVTEDVDYKTVDIKEVPNLSEDAGTLGKTEKKKEKRRAREKKKGEKGRSSNKRFGFKSIIKFKKKDSSQSSKKNATNITVTLSNIEEGEITDELYNEGNEGTKEKEIITENGVTETNRQSLPDNDKSDQLAVVAIEMTEDNAGDEINRSEKSQGRFSGLLRVFGYIFGTQCMNGCMRTTNSATDHDEESYDVTEECENEIEDKQHENGFDNGKENNEKAKFEAFNDIFPQVDYEPEPTKNESMLLTWEGFLERVSWIAALIRGTSSQNESASVHEDEVTDIKTTSVSTTENISGQNSTGDEGNRKRASDLDENEQEEKLSGEETESEGQNVQEDLDYGDQYIEQVVDAERVQLTEAKAAKAVEIFRRQIEACSRDIVKSPGVATILRKKNSTTLITPTVRRIGISSDDIKKMSTVDDEIQAEAKEIEENKNKKRPIENIKVRHVLVTGDEGQGKTTLLERYADMAMGRLLVVNEVSPDISERWHPFARKDFFNFVHFVRISELPVKGYYTPCELLFKSVVHELSDEYTEAGFRWLIDYRKSILFILDGLDEMRSIPGREHKKIDYNVRASPSCILHNLLCGNLFPNVHILSSARPYTIEHFTAAAAPMRIYALTELEKKDIKTLVKSYTPKDSKVNKPWKILEQDYPNLSIMGGIPLNLLYWSTAVLKDTENKCPDTCVAVMSRYLKCAFDNGESWNVQSVTIMTKVKKLACDSVEKNLSMLKDEVFSEVDLDLADVQQLPIFHPRSSKLDVNRGKIEEYFAVSFTHQTVQEYLAALHICEVSLADFVEFTKKHLHNPKHGFIRMVLCGLLFNEENMAVLHDIVEVSAPEEKREILLQDFRNILNSGDKSHSFYAALHEAGDGIKELLQVHMNEICLSGEKLTSLTILILTSLLSRTGNLDLFSLSDCNLYDATIKSLLTAAQKCDVTIKMLDLQGNSKLLFQGRNLRDLFDHCKSEALDVSRCELNKEKLARLQASFKGAQLKTIKAGFNNKIGEAGIQIIGDIVKSCETKSLNLNNCSLTSGAFKRLRKSLKDTQLYHLNVSENKGLDVQAMVMLGDIVQTNGVKELNLSKCEITNKEIRNFQASLKTSTMNVLDISASEMTTAWGLNVIAISRLIPHVSEEIRMINWTIDPKVLKMFQDNINEQASSDLKIIYGANGEYVLTLETEDDEEQEYLEEIQQQ